jgi:LigT like Phosphoesterase
VRRRPGWRPGRLTYTWHLTFEHAPALHRLVAAYQGRLAGARGLNPVPPRWLHLTVQEVGYVDEIPDDRVDAVVEAAAARLRDLPAFGLTFHRTVLVEESIVLEPAPAGPVAPLGPPATPR